METINQYFTQNQFLKNSKVKLPFIDTLNLKMVSLTHLQKILKLSNRSSSIPPQSLLKEKPSVLLLKLEKNHKSNIPPMKNSLSKHMPLEAQSSESIFTTLMKKVSLVLWEYSQKTELNGQLLISLAAYLKSFQSLFMTL